MEVISFLAGAVTEGVRSIGSRGGAAQDGEETGRFDALLAEAMTPEAAESETRPRSPTPAMGEEAALVDAPTQNGAEGEGSTGSETEAEAESATDPDAAEVREGSDEARVRDTNRLLAGVRFARGEGAASDRIPFGAIARAVSSTAAALNPSATTGAAAAEPIGSGPAATTAPSDLADLRETLLPAAAGSGSTGSNSDESTVEPSGGTPSSDAAPAETRAPITSFLSGAAASASQERLREASPDVAPVATDALARVTGPNPDPRTPDRSLDRIDPELRTRLERVVDRMASEHGHDVEVVEGFRTDLRQAWLFQQGRERPGPVVTWTQNSNHESGRAVDVRIDGSWNDMQAYRRLQTIAREEGLVTLGPRDPGHLELPASVATGSAGALPGADVEVERPALTRDRAESIASSRVASNGVARVARVADVASVARVASVATPGSTGFAADVAASSQQSIGAVSVTPPSDGVSAIPSGASAPAFSGPNATTPNVPAPSGTPGANAAVPGAPAPSDARTSTPRAADAAVASTDPDLRQSSSETSSDASSEGSEQSLSGGGGGSAPRIESPARREGTVGFGPTLANLQADGSSTSPIQEMRAASTLDRLEQIEALRDRAALGTSDGWRLRVADADGNGTRLDLGLRGSTVDARLGLSDPELARRAQANIAELRQSLETRGLDLEQALFRSGMSPDALESLTGPSRNSQSLDAMRAFMAELTGRPEDESRESARRWNETSEQSRSGREPNDERSNREETTP